MVLCINVWGRIRSKFLQILFFFLNFCLYFDNTVYFMYDLNNYFGNDLINFKVSFFKALLLLHSNLIFDFNISQLNISKYEYMILLVVCAVLTNIALIKNFAFFQIFLIVILETYTFQK